MKNILSHIRQHPLAQRIALGAILPAMVVMPEQVHANPSGGTVVHGAAEINADIEGHLQIFQTSNKAIINWEDFSIGEGELTQFIQPGVNATALSRVISGNPSALMGTLQANGGHILVNPNGIVVGANGVVDVAGMNVLSTLNVSDEQFLAGGDMVFTGTTPAGVTNFGTISSSEGDVILMGNFVDNQGSIGAVNGTVALGAGGSILLSSAGDATISVQGAGAGGNTGVSNSGEITAATAELKAHGNVYALAVNNSGTIRATGFNRANGRVTLSAGEPGGSIVNTGSIRATNEDGNGGIIDINAGPEGTVDIAAGEVVADGESAGGIINVVGSTVNVAGGAQVTANGDTGGSVTVGSSEFTTAVTTEAGTIISANGVGGQGGVVSVQGTADSVMTLGGTLSANGADGGMVSVDGGTITQTESGVFTANGENNGGVVSLTGSEVVLSGTSEVNGVNGNGGVFQANAEESLTVTETGVVNANGGEDGGVVRMTAENGDLQINGTANANGENGNGGTIEANAPNGDLSVGTTGVLNANGANDGGTINMAAGGDLTFDGSASANGVDGDGGAIFADSAGVTTINGSLSATSVNGVGGRIAATGEEVFVGAGADFDASGAIGGGRIFAGGNFQGREGDLREAQKTTVAAGAQFRANSTVGGNAGLVVVWADGDTFFEGSITTQALGATGNGGLIEVSGKQNLTFAGDVTASAVNGLAGTVLFDPGDVLVTDAIGVNQLRYVDLNDLLQGGTSVIIATDDGSVTFENQGTANDRNGALQWTHSLASLGVFASDDIVINEHIRTSGGGSINLIAGWRGDEDDFISTGVGSYQYFDDGATTDDLVFLPNDVLADVESVWSDYVNEGKFGDGGSVFIGSADMVGSVSVGSRYGNTNVAGTNLFITASQRTSGGESEYAHLGFRDTGTVFAIRGQSGSGDGLDLNGGVLEIEGDPLVGLLPTVWDPITEVFILDVLSPEAQAILVDKDGDTIYDGVYAVNSTGVLDENNASTGGDATFIPFATHYNGERTTGGNWWWQQIDAMDPDPQGLGGRLPENGAGQSAVQRADINVAMTGQVVLEGGGRHQNYAQIGHGGDSTGAAEDTGLSNADPDSTLTNQIGRNYVFNNGTAGRSASSIARLAGVYGNINVLAGLDASQTSYDRSLLTGNLTGVTDAIGGRVHLEGYQETGSTNSTTNPNQSNASEAYVQIGHLGTGQFGSAMGDIVVQAGGDVNVLAGSFTRSHASIGHTMNGLAYWNPSSDPSQQLRIFETREDLDNPNLRKGELFVNLDAGGAARGFYEPGTVWDAGFVGTDAQNGVYGIALMDGTVRTDLIGDITVTSGGPNGVTIKGFTNPDTRERTTTGEYGLGDFGDLDDDQEGAQGVSGVDDPDDADGLIINRDRRFAMIGHGGSNNGVDFENANRAGDVSALREFVRLRINNRTTAGGDDELASGAESLGNAGTAVNRSMVNVNIQGDISVTATRGGITLQAGNDTLDYAVIGHGGDSLGDYETSGQIVGNIDVTSAGDVLLEGGAVQADFTGNDDRDFYSQASIGHHGRLVGNQYFAGDITVIADGNITLTGGRYRQSGAKIGHQSADGYGQVGGEFERNEHFFVSDTGIDGTVFISEQEVTSTDTTFKVDLNGDGDFDDKDETKTFGHSGYTANITVEAGANGNSGDILMTHAAPGGLKNQNQFAYNNDGNLNDLRWSSVQIGHGGRQTAALRNAGDNDGFNYSAKLGDINVTANGVALTDPVTGEITTSGGNITLQNGEGPQGWWTTIGHALGNSASGRANGPDNLDFSYVMTGDINVNAFGNVILDAQFANETDTTNDGLGSEFGDPADQNHVQIGHGGGYDGRDVVVIDSGTFKGIEASSDIVMNVGNNLEIKGGNGSLDSHAQVGHGWSTDRGDEFSRPGGLNGDITVTVGNSLTLTGSPNAGVPEPGGTGNFLTVEGAAAVIGHGGYQLDADLSGNIGVYVGDLSLYNGDMADYVGNLTLQGSIRDAADSGIEGTTAGQKIGSVFNFAKIGHWSTENPTQVNRAQVDSNAIGDITVVVANDLLMNGGTTDDYEENPLLFAFAQIGNGGPGVSGDKVGDITVMVGNDFTTQDGTSMENTGGLAVNSNNYVMVGNGDWLRDGSNLVLPSTGGPGIRSGDISIAVGHSAVFDHTLIGHADPDVLTSATAILDGNTYIGVSRDFPFFGNNSSVPTSDGSLTTDNDTVFTSAFYGLGTNSELRIYAPEREDININDTRLNERTVTYNSSDTDANFANSKGSVFDASLGQDAGRDDEIYLQPDLFYDDEDLLGGNPFPESLDDVSDGSIASVDSPGGFPNLVALSAGEFGSGTTEYRSGNAVVGAGNYTFYFDAIRPVASGPTTPGVGGGGGGGAPVVTPPIIFIPEVVVEEPVPVVVTPFNFLPFLFIDKFDSLDRDDLGLGDSQGGSIFDGLGILGFFTDRDDEEGLRDGDPISALLGFNDDDEDATVGDNEEDRRRNTRNRLLGKLGSIYYVYDVNAGEYSSFREFGVPASLIIE